MFYQKNLHNTGVNRHKVLTNADATTGQKFLTIYTPTNRILEGGGQSQTHIYVRDLNNSGNCPDVYRYTGHKLIDSADQRISKYQ